MLEYQRNLEQDVHLAPMYTKGDLHFDSVRSVFDHSADNIVDAMLFKDEATLPTGVSGAAAFQKTFVADARRDKDGNSLKDLEISGHLFRNRCSYMIYSESFRNLPAPLQTRIYKRLTAALDAKTPNPRYNYIAPDECRRIDRILRQTDSVYAHYPQKPGLVMSLQPGGKSATLKPTGDP
jgi:hypothetical protein